MSQTLKAIYRDGVIIPQAPCDLADEEEIEITISKPLSKEPIKNVRTVPMIDLTFETKWLEEHGKEYIGQWVALSQNKLISHGTNAVEVYNEAIALGFDSPFLHKIESEEDLPFGGW